MIHRTCTKVNRHHATKPSLCTRPFTRVLMVVIPLQVFANIATIILDEGGPAIKGWFTWRDIFHLLDIIW